MLFISVNVCYLLVLVKSSTSFILVFIYEYIIYKVHNLYIIVYIINLSLFETMYFYESNYVLERAHGIYYVKIREAYEDVVSGFE